MRTTKGLMPGKKDLLTQKALEKYIPPKRKARINLHSPEFAPYNDRGPKEMREKLRRKWLESNEERMLQALARWKGLQFRIIFGFLGSDEKGYPRYHTVRGRTIVFRRLPNQGMLFQVVQDVEETCKRVAERLKREIEDVKREQGVF